MTHTNPVARTPQSDTVGRLHTKLDATRRQLNWLAIGVVATWLGVLVRLLELR